MTIGVGFRCEDGIVLCADNQITWPQSHKFYERKLYQHRTQEWTMVNTFAGDPELVKSFNDKFDEAIRLLPAPITGKRFREAIETMLGLLPHTDDFYMLCAVAIPNTELRLFRTTGEVAREVTTFDYIGAGDSSLLRYLSSLLTECIAEEFGSEYAYQIGCYLVLKAKTFIEGCGGDTDVSIVRPTGNVEIRDGESYNTEQNFLRLEQAFRKAAAASLDPRIPERNLDDLLGKMSERIKQNNHQLRVRIPWQPPKLSIAQKPEDQQ